MTSRRAQYVRETGAGLFAKFGSIGAGLVTLWLLNQILEKEEFGAYSFTMATLGILMLFAMAGLDHSVLYRLSRVNGTPGRLAGGGQIVWALRVVLVVSGAMTAVVAAAAAVFGPRSELPDLDRWFLGLGIIIPLAAIGGVLARWHQAQRQVARSLVVPRLNEMSLALLLLVVWFVAPSPTGVAVAVVAATAIPLIAWLVLIPRDALEPAEPLPPGDATYGLSMMATQVAEVGVRRVDLIMIGVLSTGLVAADYALAARLVALTTIGHELLGAVLTPRMGLFFERRDYAGLSKEYDLNRSLALAVGLGVAVGFTAFGDQLVRFFGDFADARPVVLVLCAAFLVKIGFGNNGRYLNMSGRAGWNLLSTVLLLATMVVLNIFLIPRWGAVGASLGTLMSFAAINTLQSSVIWVKDRFPTMHVEPLLVLMAAVALLLLSAADRLAPIPAAVVLAVLSLISGRHGWPIMRKLLEQRSARDLAKAEP